MRNRIVIDNISMKETGRCKLPPIVPILQLREKLSNYNASPLLSIQDVSFATVEVLGGISLMVVTPRPDEVHSTCNCRDAYVHQVPL